jgi:hypothetical protein
MSKFALFVTLALIASSVSFSQTTDVTGTWVPVELHWKSAPGAIDRDLKSSHTEVISLAENGRFAMMVCTIYRRGARLSVSEGDLQRVYLGTWRFVEPDIVARYQLASRTIDVAGKQSGEEQYHALLRLASGATLVFHGNRFRKEPGLDESVDENLRSIRIPPTQAKEKR